MTTSPKGVHQANSELRWQAVQDRDRSYDGRFVYAVDSTGVYCRPTCPSRRPQQSRVHFFDGPEEAERAGYRACRRCLPDQPSPQSQQAELVRRVCDRIADQILEHPEGLPSLSQLSQAAGVSPSHLQRVFRKELGLTPRQYAHARRLERFKSLVRQGNGLSDAMFDAGFSSSSRLYESSADHLGMTPGKYRKGGAGLTISHLVTRSALGCLLVAATGQGVCSVKLGDEPARLVEELQTEFPGGGASAGRGSS